MISIDELIEIWARTHNETHDDDLSLWREACQCLRPTAEDDEILEDEDLRRSDDHAQGV